MLNAPEATSPPGSWPSHETVQKVSHIPPLFCRGSEGLPPCLLVRSQQSSIQRSLHSKGHHGRPVGETISDYTLIKLDKK